MQPKVLRCVISSFDLCRTSQGDLLDKVGVGSLFMIWTDMETALDQYEIGRCEWESMVREHSTKFLCFLSATPFCYGVWIGEI